MKREQGYANIVSIFLTFSVLVVVLVIGFVAGRVMVARSYAEMAPKLEGTRVAAPGPSGETGQETASAPGRVYVPAPPTPEELAQPPSEGGETPAEGAGASGETPPAEGGQKPEAGEARAPKEPGAEERVILPAPKEVAPVEGAGEAKYSVQVGLFTVREGARQVANELGRAGFPSEIAVEPRGGQTLYRVLTGRYRTEYAAHKALEQLQQEGFAGFVVPR